MNKNLKSTITLLMNCNMNITYKDRNFHKILNILIKNEKSLSQYFKDEQKRMASDRNFSYLTYYSEECIPLAEKIEEHGLTNDALIDRMIEWKADQFNSHNFNFVNYNKLKDAGLLNILRDFDNNFRGDIIKVHTFSKWTIIETKGHRNKEDFHNFYGIGNTTYCFNDLEMALFHEMNANMSHAMYTLFKAE